MSKTINTILNLTDRFTPKLDAARKQAMIFKQSLRNCDSISKTFDSSLKKLISTTVKVGAVGAAAMGAFAVSSINTYKEFQQSMSNVAGILDKDKTSEAYKQLEAAAREAGRTTTKTATEAADALSYMALAGWETEDCISGLMPVLRASQATGEELSTTSDLITDSMSALGLSVSELDHYLDVCAKAQTKSNTTLTQMQEAYIKCGGTFNNFGTEIEESAALLGVLANRGIKGSEAGTRMQSILVNLVRKSGESAKALEAIGVSAYDADGNFRGVTETLLDVQKATAGLTDEERDNYLSMIGGKRQLTTLNALLGGLSNVTEDGRTEFEKLRGELNNSDGSLKRLASTMTDNYAGSLALAKSALDDFKITVAEKLEPYISAMLKWFAESLPNAAEKLSAVIDNKLNAAITFCKSTFEEFKPTLQKLASEFMQYYAIVGKIAVTLVTAALKVAEFLSKIKLLSAEFVIGAASGMKVFSVISKIAHNAYELRTKMKGLTMTQKLATAATTAFGTSLTALKIGAAAAGVTLLVAGLIKLNDYLKKSDIEKHFGDIALSADDCADIVRGMFGEALCSQIDEVSYAFDELDDSADSVNSSVRKLNKLNFKLDFGGNVSSEDYLSEVETYVSNLQELADDSHYSLNLSVDLVFGEDSEEGSKLKSLTDSMFENSEAELELLTSGLTEYINKAINDGVELDPNVIREQLQKIEEVKNQMALDEAEAKLEAAKYDFQTGDLSEESFENLINTTHEQLAAMEEIQDSARIKAIAGAKAAYNADPAKFISEYGKSLYGAINDINQNYTQQKLAIQTKGVQFEADAIRGVYGDEFDRVQSYISKIGSVQYGQIGPVEQGLTTTIQGIKSGDRDLTEGTVKSYTNAVDEAFSIMGLGARGNIKDYYALMEPDVKSLENLMEHSSTVAQETADAYNDANIIGAAAGNSEALNQIGVNSLSKILPDSQKKILAGTKKYGEYYSKGLSSDENKGLAQAGGAEVTDAAAQEMEKGVEADVPATLNIKPTVNGASVDINIGGASTTLTIGGTPTNTGSSGSSSSTKSGIAGTIVNTLFGRKTNAVGTTYFGGGFTRINENGGEIVDLPTGTRIIPSDKTDKLLSGNSTPVNVNVYVQGNIFGTEEAVNIIGEGVCERVVDIVAAL